MLEKKKKSLQTLEAQRDRLQAKVSLLDAEIAAINAAAQVETARLALRRVAPPSAAQIAAGRRAAAKAAATRAAKKEEKQRGPTL